MQLLISKPLGRGNNTEHSHYIFDVLCCLVCSSTPLLKKKTKKTSVVAPCSDLLPHTRNFIIIKINVHACWHHRHNSVTPHYVCVVSWIWTAMLGSLNRHAQNIQVATLIINAWPSLALSPGPFVYRQGLVWCPYLPLYWLTVLYFFHNIA